MSPRLLLTLVAAAVFTFLLGFSTAVSTANGGAVHSSPANASGTVDPSDADKPGLSEPVPTPVDPSAQPSVEPAAEPAAEPSTEPAARPSAEPSAPTDQPVYLTFDDGPDPVFTPQVLDLLAAHNAKATFFVQGSQVQAYPELAARIVAEGHSLQSHAWNHPRLNLMSHNDIVYGQLQPTNDAIQAATGTVPSCLRAPYGATGPTVYGAAASLGQEVVGWHLNPTDYNDPGAAAIAGYVLANVSPGSIVLLHDAGSGDRQQTVDAVAAMLPELAARGFQPAALCH